MTRISHDPCATFYDQLDSPGYPKLDVTTHRCDNGLELVVCQVDSPLFALYVTVPTFVKDNKGLPHTLEHLIFCGSHDYPERGYLDRLATLCQSHGTNAYTTDDHTCYTSMTSSLPGLLWLLPVYLDHIFRPTLETAIIKREVFHRDAAGGGRGVVYCEMGAREWSEQDQLDLALRRGAIGRGAPELSVYGWECGGRTKCLANLKLDEIREYHRLFYRADNATVVIVGGRSLQSELAKLISIVGSAKFLPPIEARFEAPKEPGFSVVPSSHLQFPSNDESLGSVGFAWPGPPSDSLYTITALHILLRMLKDTSASPLYQHFVESSHPIASDIDYEVKGTYETIISLLFSGVPTKPQSQELGEDLDDPTMEQSPTAPPEEDAQDDQVCYLDENVLYRELIECIREWASDRAAVQDRLEVSLKSMTIKLRESLEDDPHDVFASYCAGEIVRAHWPFKKEGHTLGASYGSSITQMPAILERLGGEPLDFWLDLLEKHILSVTPAEVRTSPSQAMNEQVKQWEREQLEDIPREELPKEAISDSTPLPVVQVEAPDSLPVTIHCQPGHEQVSLAATNVKRLTMLIEITNEEVAADDWPYLVLLQELFFNCNLKIPPEFLDNGIITNDRVTYQDLVARLSSEFSTFEASVGFGNELFSVGYLDSHMVFSLHGRVDYSLHQMQQLLRAVIAGTDIQIDRITEVLENLTSQLKDSWSEPSSILDTMLTTLLHDAHHRQASKRPKHGLSDVPFVEHALGLVSQTDFFVKARKMVVEDPEGLLRSLRRIQEALCKLPYSLHEGVGNGSITVADRADVDFWNPADRVYPLPKHGGLEGAVVNEEGTIQLIPMKDITASYLTISIPLNILPRKGDPSSYSEDEVDRMLCMAIMGQLLSYTEGPLYRRIRGAGLAYGASMSLALWSGLLTFYLDDSTDPAKAIQVFLQLLDDLLSEAESINSRRGEMLNAEAVRMAQAAQLFQFVSERSTPSSAVSSSLRCALRGLPRVGSDLEGAWNDRLLKLTVDEIATCLTQVIPLLRDPRKSIRLMAVPANSLSTIEDELSKGGHKTILNNLPDHSQKLHDD